MKLLYDLYDIYGQKIAVKGSKVDGRLIRNLVEKGAHLSQKIVSVAKTPILNDFKKALKDRRYKKVFDSDRTRRKILKTFMKLTLAEPIVLELKKMKSNMHDTYHHVLIMAALVIKMIQDIKKSNYDPILAAHLCLTHDIGKTRIQKSILNKKSALTEKQYQTIKTHPLIGYLLLCYYRGSKSMKYCQTAFKHHEKLDGSGYPRGIKSIDRYSQLIAPVDIYDALISKRPYRKLSYNGRLALDILLEDAKNKKLNKKNIYLLINCLRKEKTVSLTEMKVSKKRRSADPQGNLYGRVERKMAQKLLQKD